MNLNEMIEKLANFNDQNIQEFIPGETHIPVSGKVYGSPELKNALTAVMNFWLTEGEFSAEFSSKLKQFIGSRSIALCNSGSSANLLAISSITNKKIPDHLEQGDEVITSAVGFPTTVSPILQNNLRPVFIDIELGTYNVIAERIESAISSKTKAICIAHTLGNPFNLQIVTDIAKKYNLFLIEDTCDALGATYSDKKVGTFGELATLSFYPAHHITTGEGGAVLINKLIFKPVIESLRDWGRDCWCATGFDNTCKKRFDWKFENLPFGYDHKYTYSNLGYNLKIGDIHSAIGLAQLERLELFVESRRANWEYLHTGLKKFEDFLILPSATPNSNPSWFGFAITIKKSAPFERVELINYLDTHKIGTRLLFGGNLTRQPAFSKTNFRIHGDLSNSDYVTENTFWIGVWPGLTESHLEYMVGKISEFIRNLKL